MEMLSTEDNEVKASWMDWQDLVFDWAKTTCQVFQHIDVYRYSPRWWRIAVPWVLWKMDKAIGLNTHEESRAPNYNTLVRSGRLETMKQVIELVLQLESGQNESFARKLEDCQTFHDAFHHLLHAKTIERLRRIQLFMDHDSIANHPYVWRLLWGGTLQDLNRSGLRAQLELGDILGETPEEIQDNNTIGPSGHGHDIEARFVREPDDFDVLGRILYPRAFDNIIPSARPRKSLLDIWHMQYDLPIRLRHTSRHSNEQISQTTSDDPSSVDDRSGRNSNTSNRTSSNSIGAHETQHDLPNRLRSLSISSSGPLDRSTVSESPPSSANRPEQMSASGLEMQYRRWNSVGPLSSPISTRQQRLARRRLHHRSTRGRVLGRGAAMRHSQYCFLTRGPPVRRQRRRAIAARATEQREAIRLFLTALARAAENRDSQTQSND